MAKADVRTRPVHNGSKSAAQVWADRDTNPVPFTTYNAAAVVGAREILTVSKLKYPACRALGRSPQNCRRQAIVGHLPCRQPAGDSGRSAVLVMRATAGRPGHA